MTPPPQPPDRDFDDEIAHHIRERADALIRSGWDPPEAEAEARRRFGDPAGVRAALEAIRRGRGGPLGAWGRGFLRDLRLAARSLARAPTFAGAVVLSLALGIGAAASAFAVLDALLLRPLAYRHAERWVYLNATTPSGAATQGQHAAQARYWLTEGKDVFDGLVGWGSDQVVRLDGLEPEALSVVTVTPGTERELGIPVVAGRGFTEQDAVPGAPDVVLLTEAYWRRTGADSSLIGRTIRLETGPAAVVGVVGSGLRFPSYGDERQMWAVLRSDLSYLDRSARGVQALWGLLPEGVPLAVQQSRLDARTAALEEQQPLPNPWGVRLRPIDALNAGAETRQALWVLFGTTLALLVMGLVSAVNLVLVRATTRTRELAVRTALGGTRGALFRLLLAEGLLLGLASGALAVLVARVRLLAVDPGFETERIAEARLMLSPTRYETDAARADLLRRLEDALEARPEIGGVTVVSSSGFAFGDPLEAEGRRVREDQPELVPFAAVQEDFLNVLGIAPVSGRGFVTADAGTDHAVVDADLARFLWGQGDPVGRRFRLGAEGAWWTVVGVVPELRLMGRDQRSGPYQYLLPADPAKTGGYAEFRMRTAGDPARLPPLFRETLRELDPEQWIWSVRTAEEALAEEEGIPRFLVAIMTTLASLATLLAALGVYGVLAVAVERRRRELGIRIALGAGLRRLRRSVLLDGVKLAGLGAMVGGAVAMAGAGYVGALLYELEPRDPRALATAAAVILAVAAVAAWVPAVRATRVDPAEVLRAE
ncbi:MAG: ABC transporter permease [Gemmatimonadota bacterium]